MDQENFEEPEKPTGLSALPGEAEQSRTMSIQEHAALVQSIMLNFPEIYEEQAGANFVRKPAEKSFGDRSFERPATA